MTPKAVEVHTDFNRGTVDISIRNDRIRTDREVSTITVDANEAEALREQLHLASFSARYGVRS